MRYFIGFLITIGLVILLIILLFSGGEKKPPTNIKTLDSYASTDAQVRLTTDGAVTAVSQHEQIRITVDRNNVVYEHLNGYDGNVVETQLFSNTESSYETFLFALRRAGFTRGNPDPALREERGHCPTGNRYIFELIHNDETLQRYWGSSCSNLGNYEGSLSLTRTLFEKQVPDYNQRTSSINLTP